MIPMRSSLQGPHGPPSRHHSRSETTPRRTTPTPRHIAHARRGQRGQKREYVCSSTCCFPLAPNKHRPPLDVYEAQQQAAAEWAEEFFDQYHAAENAAQATTSKIVFADPHTGDAPPDVIATATTKVTTKEARDEKQGGKQSHRALQRSDTLGYPEENEAPTKLRARSHERATTSAATARDAPRAASKAPRSMQQQPQQREAGDRQRGPREQPRKQRSGNGANAPDDANFFSATTFAKLGVSPKLQDALATIGIERPSHVQAKALQAMASDARYVVLADAAGSGKTLAYVVPIVQQLHAEEEAAGARVTRPNAPRAVLLVPTEELALQLLAVCRSISASLPFRVVAVTGRGKRRTQRQFLDEGVDVVIATPGRLTQLLEEGALRLDGCHAVVLDEVDVLLGATADFVQQVTPIRDAAGPSTRFLFVTATLPEPVWMDLQMQFPSIRLAAGPRLHRHAPGLEAELIDCSGGDEITEESGFQRKAAALYAVMQERKAARTIVFCNKIETCRKVENFLNRRHRADDAFEVLPYHRAIADDARAANLRKFLKAPRGAWDQSVLVCTDRASRGMDSTYVDHVVLFDWPRDPSEYVRRVGRTARGAGGEGAVSILVLGRQVSVARDVLSKVQKGQPVHRIPES